MICEHLGLPLVPEPRPAFARREPSVTRRRRGRPLAAATPHPTSRRRADDRPRDQAGRSLASGAHDPGLPLPVPPDRHRGGVQLQRHRAACTNWEGFSLRWYQFRPREQGGPEVAVEQPDRRARRRDPGDGRRHDGRPRAPTRPAGFRLPFDGLTYVSIIVPEIVIALATLLFFATTSTASPDHR